MTSSYSQRGLSIVELLVASVIGMLLLTGVVQVFFASKQTYTSNEASSRLQENGRFALEFIAQSARMAGYLEAANSQKSPPLAIAGSGSCETPNVCGTQGTGSASDTVGFALQPRISDNVRRDCRGNTITGATANTDVIINHFSIVVAAPDPNKPNDTPTGSLTCKAWNLSRSAWVSNATAQPLVEGIDALQVQYGIGTGVHSDGVREYVSADRVGNNRWGNVVAVRIAVLANSVNATTPRTPQRPYVLLDAQPFIPNDDGRARQVFTTTINLRNTN